MTTTTKRGSRELCLLVFILGVLFVVCFTEGVEGLIAEKTITFKRTGVSVFQKFGFEKGGRLTISALQSTPDDGSPSLAPPLPSNSSSHSVGVTIATTKLNVSFFLCNSDEWRHFLASAEDVSSFCYVKQSNCEIDGIDVINLQNYEVKSKDFYRLILVSCSPLHLEVSLNYSLVNLNGEQLSYGDVILPRFFSVICGIWLSGLIGCVYLACALRTQPEAYLFNLFSVLLALKLLVNACATLYWSSCSVGICINVFLLLQNVFFAVSEAMFFSILLLIAKGWRITRDTLPTKEIKSVVLSISALLAILVFFSFYNETYPFLSLMILYFFMLPQIFRNVGQNVRLLHLQASLLRNPSTVSSDDVLLIQQLRILRSAIRKKLLVFKNIKISVLVYLGLILIVTMLKIVIVWYLDYANYIMDEIVVLAVFVSVGVGLRLYDSRVFTVITFPNLDSQYLDDYFREDNNNNSSNYDNGDEDINSNDLSVDDETDLLRNRELENIIIVVYPSSKDCGDGHVSELPLALACKQN